MMHDYQAAYREMSVASAERDLLRGRLASGLNAAIECCDRWAEDNRIVLEWVGREMQRETVTYASLKADSERFANLLGRRGIGKGDIVAGLLPRIPELLGDDLNPAAAGAPGILAVDLTRSPLCTCKGYWRADTPAIQGNWYLTGDTMMRDADGHFFFVGRSDDIITSSGYRIGPFDVESALIEHPAVAEVGVIGKPDPERTEIVKACIVLKAGQSGSPELTAELQEHVRRRLASHAFPRQIAYLTELPKTPSGKIQRFVLRQMN